MNILDELEWRGLIADCTDKDELVKRLGSAPLVLRRFQTFGHHPIAVAGGATGSIGDPSGKTAERQLLTKQVLDANIAFVKEQLRRLLDFETKTNPARLVDNATW